MKLGIAYSNDINAFMAGKNIAEKALQGFGLERADLVLAFCHGSMDHTAFYKGLRSVVGDMAPIIGGSAVGVVTNDHLSYEGAPAAAAIIQAEGVQCSVFSAQNLDKNEAAAGMRLGDALSREAAGKLLLLFYDSVKTPPVDREPPVLNASAPLLKGLGKKIANKMPILGAGLLGDYVFAPTAQFCGTGVNTQTAVAALLHGDFTPYFRITHGCTPLDGIYHTITKMEGPILYELDGRPIIQVIDDLYGHTRWRDQHPVKLLTIGVNHGERFQGPDEAAYVNRLIMGVMPDEEGIFLFEPDLAEGTEIQFMLRDTEAMMASARDNVHALFKEIAADGKRAAFGLYIDCAGRAGEYNNISSEEAHIIQNAFNQHTVPLLGFYSGVELAPMLGKTRGLDWTGVLVVITEEK